MSITFDELKTLLVIVDSGSLTAAANLLGQTVSGISRTLTRLEQKLNVTLLERTTRHWALTHEGRYFLDKARQILDVLAEAQENVQSSEQNPEGRLRISAPFPFIKHIILPLLAKFQQQYPKITLILNSDDAIIDLLENQTDIAIRIAELKDSSLYARLLMQSKLRLVASPAYLQQYGIPKKVQHLNDHQLLGFSKNKNLNIWPIMEHDQYYTINPTISASSGELIRDMALSGQGIACLSDFMIKQDIVTGHLIEVLPHQVIDQFQHIYAVYYKQNHLAARIRCFIDFLSKNIANL